MSKLRVCNLFAGIGGNRRLWPDNEIDVTAVEMDPDIAAIYQDFFPNDTVIVEDAHQYLLDHYKEFDFVWSSPPCPTHSRFNLLSNVQEGKTVKYPDMSLYQEIIYLMNWSKKQKWIIENVISYYKPLINPQEINNHYFWANFYITPTGKHTRGIRNEKDHINIRAKQLGFDINKIPGNSEFKRKILNNCTEPKTGKHIYDCAFKNIQMDLLSV